MVMKIIGLIRMFIITRERARLEIWNSREAILPYGIICRTVNEFFFLKVVSKGFVKFKCEVEVFDEGYFETHDTSGAIRIGIKFFFKRIGAYVPLLADLPLQTSILTDQFEKYGIVPPTNTEKKGLVTSRVGQGAYRKSIIHRWEYKCAVTGFNKLDILIASHIVPWSDSTDNERLDVDNGLLLSPTYDALFDRNLISFENDGKIILSNAIDNNAYKKIGITGKERISNLSINNHSYLDRHRIILNTRV